MADLDHPHAHGKAQASRLRRLVAAVRLPLSKKFDGSTAPSPSPNAAQPTGLQLPPEVWGLVIRHATAPAAAPHYHSDPETVSFLSLPHTAPRLASHRALMRRKARLTLVCRTWHALAQEVLFEFVWLARERQARLLAAVVQGTRKGRYIKRLHVETPALERCSAADLRTILDHAPALAVYSDYRSVRRRNTLGGPLHTTISSSTTTTTTSTVSTITTGGGSSGGTTTPARAHAHVTTTFSPHTDPASPDSLLTALARPGNALRRLSWTNYDDLAFHLRLSPLLLATGASLEFLELNFCSQLDSSRPSATSAFTSPSASASGLAACTGTAYARSLTLPALRSLKVTLDNATFAVLATWDMPALQNLSVLAADFSYYSEHGTVLGGEHAPSGFELFFLTHGEKVAQLELGHSSSVIEEHWVTAPPRRTGPGPGIGFGPGGGAGGGGTGTGRIALSAWCPNLTTFICSADAEWNWQSPDWIAPHVLLPAHPGVRLIGVRDIGKRIVEALGRGSSRDGHGSYGVHEGGWGEGGGGWGGGGGEGEFFMLGEQMGSLLRREAFPSLLYVRDMSYGSDVLRRGGVEPGEEEWADPESDSDPGSGGRSSGAASASASAGGRGGSGGGGARRWPWARLDKPRSSSDLQAARDHRVQDRLKVLRFWGAVLERCREGGVWLEDWRGVNVTAGDLRRAGVVVGRGAGRG